MIATTDLVARTGGRPPVSPLPQMAQPDEVVSFYRQRLEPQWTFVEHIDGPAVNFRVGRAFLSINVASWRAHQLEIAVDHGDGRASGGANA